MLEQGFEIRLELRPGLHQLGEIRQTLERLREAETLAERLNDDRRRGRVCALITNTRSLLGELDEALASGTRALEIAGRLGDLKLRILATSYLEQAHYWRGDCERVVELATDNLAALPADWVYEYFGATTPPSVSDRGWLIMSLAGLGRFAEAVEHEAEAIRLAAPTHHPYTVGQAHRAASTLHLLKGDWSKARSLIEHGIAVLRTGDVVLLLPDLVASSAWILAARRGERGAEPAPGRRAAPRAPCAGNRRHSRLARLFAGSCLSVAGPARRGAAPGPARNRIFSGAPGVRGPCAAPRRRHRDPSRPLRCRTGRGHYRQALAFAEPRGMRPLIAHCHLSLAKLHRRTGKREQARDHLTIATTMYREMDMRFWLEQAAAEMGA